MNRKRKRLYIWHAYSTNDALLNDSKVNYLVTLTLTLKLKIAFWTLLLRLGYCFTPYQRPRLNNGAPFSRLLRHAGDTERILGLNPRRTHGGWTLLSPGGGAYCSVSQTHLDFYLLMLEFESKFNCTGLKAQFKSEIPSFCMCGAFCVKNQVT